MFLSLATVATVLPSSTFTNNFSKSKVSIILILVLRVCVCVSVISEILGTGGRSDTLLASL